MALDVIRCCFQAVFIYGLYIWSVGIYLPYGQSALYGCIYMDFIQV